MPGQTIDEARTAHKKLYPEDNIETTMVVGWEPMTKEAWAAKYCVATVQG